MNATSIGAAAASTEGRTLAFALLPASYADPTWWNPQWLPMELFERLRENPRSTRHLSVFLLRQAGLAAACTPRRDSAETRIALTPPDELNRSVFLAGLTLLSPMIARVLRGRDRSAIKAAIGQTDYEFATKRGRLLLQQARLTEEVQPSSVEGFGGLAQECRGLGVGALATALKNAPDPVARRTQFKLPKRLVDESWRHLSEQHDAFLKLFELLRPQVHAR